MKVYYVEFTQSDGATEERGLQPIVASSEAKALEYAKQVLEKESDGGQIIASMKTEYKTYHIEFTLFKEGNSYFLEQSVEAVDIYDAMEIVENYCCDHYGTCEITRVEEIRK